MTRDRLLVRAPVSRTAERRYVLDVVLSEWLGFEYRLEPIDGSLVQMQLIDDSSRSTLTLPDVFLATPDDTWLTERSMPATPLAAVAPEAHPNRPGEAWAPSRTVPILFGVPNPKGRPWESTDRGLTLSVDVLGSVFFCLTRYEEIVGKVRDRHERFPASASIAATEGFLDRPIADEYVDLLWSAMKTLWPQLVRTPRRFRLRLTHDVDHPWATYGRPMASVAHAVGGDLVRRRDAALAIQRVRAYAAAARGRVDQDPFNTFDLLMETSERHGLQSVFNFIAGTTAEKPRPAWYAADIDGGYRLDDPPIARLLAQIHDRGHEVGLHASYGTFGSAEQTIAQFRRLKSACQAVGFEQPVWGVRQHYLRFENPGTWRNQELAGLDYDSTLGYADRPGFRGGSCREYPLFDLQARRAMTLRERPLVVMDATLLDDPAVTLDEAAARMVGIVDACRRQHGDAVVLFHNSSLAGRRRHAFYRDLVKELARDERA
jgi:peptidoglycan/xylan/chitin deacetylase (PgdA/CDA1 family)